MTTETPDQASRRRAGIKDYACGLCGEEFGSNCDPGDIQCTNNDCDARLCPCCGAWFNEDGDSSQEPHAAPGLAAATAERDGAYRERARLVAFLAACYPSEMTQEHEGDPWPVVYVLGPSGQMSWHIARADLGLFDHVGWYGTEPQWDGHTTEQKYDRLAELIPHAMDARDEPPPAPELAAGDPMAAESAPGEGELAAARLLTAHAHEAIAAAIRREEAAEAKVAEAREVTGNFLAEYGDSEIPMFKVAQDLANSLRKILGEAEAPDA